MPRAYPASMAGTPYIGGGYPQGAPLQTIGTVETSNPLDIRSSQQPVGVMPRAYPASMASTPRIDGGYPPGAPVQTLGKIAKTNGIAALIYRSKDREHKT